jgi:deazaflavin-dependent oxidoreductase (nitroreductase family)
MGRLPGLLKGASLSHGLIDQDPPRVLARFLFRLPILAFHARLGWLFGNRFLLLTHFGRNTGFRRQVVLEVVWHDNDRDAFIVASGWGPKSDWYKNILSRSRVEFQARRRLSGFATPLDDPDARRVIRAYSTQHALAFRLLSRWILGRSIRPDDEDLSAMTRRVPLVRLAADNQVT